MRKKTQSAYQWLKKRPQYVAGFVLVLIACGLVIALTQSSSNPSKGDQPDIVTHSTDQPDEQKPGPDYNWVGASNDPKKIIIPSVGIDGFVQKVGVDQNNQIAVPNNVHMAGWFIDSVRPGEKGLSIIDAHLDGRINAEALFSTLPSVKQNDAITVEFGDGSQKVFIVSEMHEVGLNEASSVLFSQNPTATNQLNLITCVGTYDKAANTYDKRFIVYAQLKQ